MDWSNPERASDRAVVCAGTGLAHSAAAAGTDGPGSGRRGADAAPPAPVGSTAPSTPPDPAAGGGSLPAEWFHRYFDVLWRLVARLGVAGHSVDDLVQETFITASRRRADIRAGQERRFLIGTAVRLSANHRQRAHVRREVCDGERLELEASAVPDAEHLLIEKHLRALLDAALATLPDAHREVFVLYELEGFSTHEIGEMLGIPLGTVASRLARARASFSKAARSLQTEHP
ncbi:MAG TPA: RNA polymerase sigma factor [Polyangiaceae bacterium]|nr:RNA polymerase sigma factor [Polyangiaceae bacterium]